MIEPIQVHSPHVGQVIILNETRGAGTEESPFRSVRQIFTLEGLLLAEYDQWKEENKDQWEEHDGKTPDTEDK